jgi:hypothetical protein
MYSVLADVTLVVHFAFVVFVVAGGLLVMRWPRLVWAHIPAAVWGALIEFGGWVCPLTPLENEFRRRAGEAAYGGGFVERYLLPVIYPGAMTRTVQVTLGVLVIAVNALIYGLVFWRRRKRMRVR